ncbi:MAG: hypothetical protein MUE41_14380 [Gemmatimonadaceae bacterium]|nr:hypothetical protein [Gemmatimonadaceae bacterium]
MSESTERAAECWPPTRDAALARLALVRPDAYARTRNHLEGAVTGLSPYITHGILRVREVLALLRERHALQGSHALVRELGWREYFRHAWRHDGDGIFRSRHPGPLPDDAYAREMPADIAAGATGLAVIDRAVHTLHATGLLHNHARLWLASYIVHLRKVHWLVGAEWLYAQLLDGDLASNHLSWQWVAGTASSKPYLFNADNVARFAPTAWHVPGTVLDMTYAELERVAGDAGWVAPTGRRDVAVPATTFAAPPDAPDFVPPDPRRIDGMDVRLVHPWALDDVPPGSHAVAVLDRDFHARHRWSARRWAFVTARLRALAPVRFIGSAASLVQALRAARRVEGIADPHLDRAFDALPLSPDLPAFGEPGSRLPSFSAWWKRAALPASIVPSTPLPST